MVGKANEQALLIVNGREFRDWETVMVRHAIREQPPFRFRFTCSEGLPLANNWFAMQIKPGDECQVFLAGKKAISGKVTTRQVYYDKKRHYVEIQGATYSTDLTGAAPVTKTMEFKDVTFQQLANSLLKPHGIPFKVIGGQLPQLKFPRVSLMHGVSVFDHLDLYSRSVGASFTSNPEGDFVAVVGPEGAGDALVEGKNILIGRLIMYNPNMASNTPQLSQDTGSDKKAMAQVSHVPFLSQEMQQFTKQFMPFALPMELPTADQEHMKGRGGTERNWQAEDQITVFCTVYGWQQNNGELWKVDSKIPVTSPMLLNGDLGELTLKSATFTQDNNEGTRTVLELMNANALGGQTPQMK